MAGSMYERSFSTQAEETARQIAMLTLGPDRVAIQTPSDYLQVTIPGPSINWDRGYDDYVAAGRSRPHLLNLREGA